MKSIQLHDSIEELSQKIVSITLHYITLHYITLHYITLHHITSHYITLHHITLRYIALHCIALHCIALHCIALHYITLHYTTLHYITSHYITLHHITSHYITLHHITSHYITLHHITSHYITLHHITSHYITLHHITSHYITLHHITSHYITLHYITLHYAFKVYVRPLLEYASTTWSPSYVTQIIALESVQRDFTKRVPGYGHLSYAERLSLLKLESLQHRRLIADLVFCFNILKGNNCIQPSDFFSPSLNTNLRGHLLKLTVPLAKTNTRKFFFSNRIVPIWNSLPADLVLSPNVKSFKFKFRQTDLNKHLIFHP